MNFKDNIKRITWLLNEIDKKQHKYENDDLKAEAVYSALESTENTLQDILRTLDF